MAKFRMIPAVGELYGSLIEKMTHASRCEIKRGVFVVALFACLSMSAQKAQIKVGYDYEVSNGGQVRKDDYILLCGKQGSMFYNPTALWMDINSKDDAACQAYGAMAAELEASGRGNEVPNRSVSMYVFKDFGTGNKTVYDDYSDQFAKYDEPFEEMQWEIAADSTKTVLEYECMMARASYHGRFWTAWFTPEVPVQDGPWKFAGLPGLILMVTESQGMHSFTANGIETTEQEIPGMVRDDWYHKEDRIKYLQGKYRNLQDPFADLAGGNLSANAKIFVNGVETTVGEVRDQCRKELDSGYDFLETDYHK